VSIKKKSGQLKKSDVKNTSVNQSKKIKFKIRNSINSPTYYSNKKVVSFERRVITVYLGPGPADATEDGDLVFALALPELEHGEQVDDQVAAEQD
jgi:hypothetical protein